MKIAFTLLSSLIIISTAFAGNESRLTISVTGKTEFEIVVDNRSYTTENNALLISGIKPGYHTIKVYRIRGGRGNAVRVNDRNGLVNTSTILVKPGYHIDIMINRFGKALVDEEAMITLQNVETIGNRVPGIQNKALIRNETPKVKISLSEKPD
jgi:hypothetical protein